MSKQNSVPPADNVKQHLPNVYAMLARVQRGIRFRDTLRAGEACLAVGIGLWVSIVLLDWLLSLAPQARTIALASVGAITAIVFIRSLGGAAAGRIGPLYLASRIERANPAFANRLIAAVELAESGTPAEGPQALVYSQAEELARSVDADEVVRSEPGQTPVHKGLLSALGLLLVGILLTGQGFLTHSVRLVFPWLDIRSGEAQFLTVRPRNIRLAEGESFEITAAMGGEAPDEVVAEFSFDDGSSRSTVLGRSIIGLTWKTGVNDIPASGAFRLRAQFGDRRPDLVDSSRSITLMRRPRARRILVAYSYPKYTRLPGRKSTGGPIDALTGTRVTIEVVPSCGLKSAALQIAGGERIRLTKVERASDSVEVWRGSLVVRRSGSYQIEMVGADEVDAATSDMAIVARPDREPRCDAVADAVQPAKTLATGVTFHVGASDDVAVEEFVLVVKRSDAEGAATTVPLRGAVQYVSVPGFKPGVRQMTTDVTVPPQILPLEAGVDYVYYVRVADGCPPEPHLVKSAERQFRIAKDSSTGAILAQQRTKKRRPPLLEPQDNQPDEPLGPSAGGGQGSGDPPPSRSLAGLNDGNNKSRQPSQPKGGGSSKQDSSPYANAPGLNQNGRDQNRQDQGKPGQQPQGGGGSGSKQGSGQGSKQGQASGSQGQGSKGSGNKGSGGGGSGQQDGNKPQLPGQGEPASPGGQRTASQSPGGGGSGPGGAGRSGKPGGGSGSGNAPGGGKQRQDAPDASGQGAGGGGAPNAGKQEKRERDGGMPTGGERGPGVQMPETVDDDAVASLDVKDEDLSGVRVSRGETGRSARDRNIGSDLGSGRRRSVGPMTGRDRVVIPRRDLPSEVVLRRRPVDRAYRALVSEYFRRLRELSDSK